MLAREKTNATRAKIRRRLVLKASHDNFKDFAFNILVNAALRDRGDEARLVIVAELKQLMGTQV
jgi:hypothetical protein